MDWLLPVRPWISGLRNEPEEAVFRRLFHERQIDDSSRVLVAGCAQGGLLQWLSEHGIEAVGLDWRPDCVLAARAAVPQFPVRLWRPAQEAPLEQGGFDLVLALDVPEHDQDLFSPNALIVTANLVSAVRPGGGLVLLRHVPAGGDAEECHRRSCYARHLGSFAGTCNVRFVADAWSARGLWRSLASGRSPGGHLVATLQIPDSQLALTHWRSQALKTLARQTAGAACCDRQPARERETTLRAA